jgi:hypothetical protein
MNVVKTAITRNPAPVALHVDVAVIRVASEPVAAPKQDPAQISDNAGNSAALHRDCRE